MNRRMMSTMTRPLYCTTGILAAWVSLSLAGATTASTRSTQSEGDWDTFSVDLSIERHQVRDDGVELARAPSVTYHLTRELVGSRWKTIVLVDDLPKAAVTTRFGPRELANPFQISRFEYEQDGEEPRVYNKQGQLLRFPTPAELAKATPAEPATERQRSGVSKRPKPSLGLGTTVPRRDWVENLVPSGSSGTARRAKLEQKFGQPVGAVRGLTRFVLQEADLLREILVDPLLNVLVEVNVIKTGKLDSHTVYLYTSLPGGQPALAKSTVEQRQSNGERLISQVSYANLKLERKR